ncbi:MAG: prolipoprotein diacylglyceryl transferase [Candidatus Binatia bacterium]
MQPYLFGFQSYFMAWMVAAGVGAWTGMRLARRHGLPLRESFLAWALLSVALLIGSKLLYLAEHAIYPLDDPDPLVQASLMGFTWHGFRIPGGMLLLVPALPLVCRALGLPVLKFADAMAPSALIGTGVIRIGCFLNGCCFGRLTSGPLGVSFPRGSRAWEWQYVRGYIPAGAAHALPVVPLQVCFAALGFAGYALGLHWQRNKQFDGQVWANSNLLFFGATFVLEWFRSTPFHLNLILAASVVVLTALARDRLRAWAVAAAHVAS